MERQFPEQDKDGFKRRAARAHNFKFFFPLDWLLDLAQVLTEQGPIR
jgi:hypothetical protein